MSLQNLALIENHFHQICVAFIILPFRITCYMNIVSMYIKKFYVTNTNSITFPVMLFFLHVVIIRSPSSAYY